MGFELANDTNPQLTFTAAKLETGKVYLLITDNGLRLLYMCVKDIITQEKYIVALSCGLMSDIKSWASSHPEFRELSDSERKSVCLSG